MGGIAAPATREWCRRHARLLGFCVFVVISFAWFAKVWADPVHRHAGVSGDPDAYIAAAPRGRRSRSRTT